MSRISGSSSVSVIGLFLISNALVGQNLVPNASFEEFTDQYCDWYTNSSELATDVVGWEAPTWATSDIFSMLLPTSCWSHPISSYFSFTFGGPIGHEAPHTDDRMAGIQIATLGCGGPNYREYLQIQLTEPLVPGVTYCTGLWWSLADNCGLAADGLSILISDTPLSAQNCTAITNVTPQVVATQVLSDTTGWNLLQGTFTATSAGEWIVVGSFVNDVDITYQPNQVGGGWGSSFETSAYYFIDDVFVTANCSMEAALIGDTLICQGDSTVLTALNGTTHLWADAAAPSVILDSTEQFFVQPQQTTTYLHYGTDTLAITVHVVTAPVVDLGPDLTVTGCAEDTLFLDATALGADMYLWSTGDSVAQIQVQTPGLYWVTVQSGVCSASDTIVVSLNALSVDLGPDTSLCPGATLQLEASTPGADHLWSTSDTTAVITVNAAGTYWLVTTIGNCTAADTIVVDEYPLPLIDLGPDLTVCAGESVVLQPSTNGSVLQWSTGEMGPAITVGAPGTYWATATLGACTASDTLTLASNPLPLVDLGPDLSICPGTSITLTNSFGGGAHVWNTGSTADSITVSAAATIHLSITVDGCTASDTVHIRVTEPPPLPLPPDTILCQGHDFLVDLPPELPPHYWQNGVEGPLLITGPGQYILTIEHGCGTLYDTLEVQVQDCTPLVHVPNAFSPNGDGINEVFVPVIATELGISQLALRIFDRWGELIFTTFEVGSGWDGTYGGQVAQDGIYVWSLDIRDVSSSARHSMIGHVTLLR